MSEYVGLSKNKIVEILEENGIPDDAKITAEGIRNAIAEAIYKNNQELARKYVNGSKVINELKGKGIRLD